MYSLILESPQLRPHC